MRLPTRQDGVENRDKVFCRTLMVGCQKGEIGWETTEKPRKPLRYHRKTARKHANKTS